MECFRTFLYICWICFHQGMFTLSQDIANGEHDNSAKPSTTVDLKVLYNQRKGNFSHFEQDRTLTIQFEYQNKGYIVDLIENWQLEAEHAVLRYKRNGTYVSERVKPSAEERCLYTGSVRHSDDSTAAISTCDGAVSGVVWEPGQTLLLSPALGGRLLLQVSRTGPSVSAATDQHRPRPDRRRRRREAASLRGPVRAGPKSLYLELALVLDNDVYRESGHDLKTAHRRAKQIANIVHSIYARLDIFVALVGVEVWTEGDEITLSANADDTLTNFQHYRRDRLSVEMPNDNAQLITGTQFEGGIVGKAQSRAMCTYDKSSGVSTDHSTQVSLVAATVAHEMGHNFGLEHDSASCDCPDDRCIMSASSGSVAPTRWSSCSKEQLRQSLRHGLGHCLHDKPSGPLFAPPVCGNGFVEAGEECDCGLPSDCTTPCCDPSSCRLRHNGTCASGACCDLQTCRPRPAGEPCRPAGGECDLAEYCSGAAELCPADVYRRDGLACGGGQSHCYGGQCGTRDDQCRLLWGASGSNSAPQCYHQNVEGNHRGDCGYTWQNQSYAACRPSDVLCGRLHCAHLNERLEYGVESSAKLPYSFMKLDGKVLPCRSAIIDLGLRQRDPGLVPQGASCGSDQMCVDQRCVPVGSVTAGGCPGGCGGRGVCNSRGNCHCDYGWAPPNCTERGVGGSVDSGPNLQRDAAHTAAVVLFVVFLGVVPLLALLLCCLYCRRHGLTPAQFLRRPACCQLPACRRLPACCRLPACVCPTLPSLATLRQKLPTGGGGSSGARPAGAARSVRRPDVPRDPPGKPASYNIRLLVLSGEDELLQAAAAPSRPLPPATAPSRPPPPAATAPSRPPPPAAAPAPASAAVPPGRGLASSLLGRLSSLARPASTEGTGRPSDRLVCEVKPTTKPAAKPTVTPTTSPTRKPAGKGSGAAEPAAGRTAGSGDGGRPVQKVVADKLRPSQAGSRTTFGMLGRQPAGTAADKTASDKSAADAKRRTTFGMTSLGKNTSGKGDDRPAGDGPAAGAAGKGGGSEAGDRAVSGVAAARSAFLSKEAGKPSVPAGPPPARVATGQVKFAANTLEKKPKTNAPEKTAGGTLDRKYANIPDKTPTAAAEKKPAALATLEKKQTSACDKKPAVRSVLDTKPSPLTQAEPTSGAAERIPLVHRSDSVPAAREPGPGQVRFAPDTLERRPAVARSDSAPAGARTAGPSSRSSTLESDSGSTGERDGGSRTSTLSRVANVFRRGDKASEPPSAAAATEPGLRASQSFKAAKLDRDTVRNLGISNPIPQPPGQFSTLPTSPRGKRGPRAPVRTSSNVGRPLRPVSLLVRPSEPPPRPPNAADLYDDCNADWSAGRGGGGGTPTENIYCTIDEAPDERPRPKSMVEPAVLADGDRLYQNTADRRAPWRSVSTRQPTVGRAQSAKAWSPIAEERSPSASSLAKPAAVSQPAKTTTATASVAAQPRASVPWASKFSSGTVTSAKESAAGTSSPNPVAAGGYAAQKPIAAVAPATVPVTATASAKQAGSYATPAGKTDTADSAAASRSAAAPSAVASRLSAASDAPAKLKGVSSAPERPPAESSATSKESGPTSPPAKQSTAASKPTTESPGSVRSVKSASSTKSSVSSAPLSKKSTNSAPSSKQPVTSTQSSKQTTSLQSSKPSSSSPSSKKVTTPSSTRPGTLSAASSQQSMSSIASTRSNVSSPSSEKTDVAAWRKGAVGKKAGTAATKKSGTGKTAAVTTAGSTGKKTGTALGKKTAAAAAGGRVTSPAPESADKSGAKAGSAASKTSSAAAEKSGTAAAKKEPASAAARVGPAPTKASAARAAAAAAKVGAAASKTGAAAGRGPLSGRTGGGPGGKTTPKS